MDDLKILECKDGIRLFVIANPKASSERIDGIHDGMLKISVTAAPDKGKANDAIIKFLAKVLDMAKSSIELVSGESSKRKVFKLRDCNIESLKNALSKHIGNE